MTDQSITTTKSEFDDEIDLKDIIAPLWRAKYWVLTLGLVFLVLTFIYSLGSIIGTRDHKHASIQVNFSFPGVEDGVFPNGDKFSPQELISSSVLSEVYKNLDDPKFSYSDLANAVDLVPDFDGREKLESVVSELVLKEKGLTIQEYGSAISQYTNANIVQSKKNVILSVDLNAIQGNVALASELLTSIPKKWADYAINNRGVLKNTSPLMSNVAYFHKPEDPLIIQVSRLKDIHNLLSVKVNDLLQSGSTASIADPKSNTTLADLKYRLDSEKNYRISVLTELVAKDVTSGFETTFYDDGFRNSKLGILEREKSKLERLIVVYDKALVEFNQQQGDTFDEPNIVEKNGSGTTLYSQQYSEDVINRLMEIGSKMSDPDYRKSLLQKKIDISTQLQSVVAEIELFSSTEELDKKSNESITQISIFIEDAFTELSQIHASLIGIIKISELNTIGDNGELYDLVGSIQQRSYNSSTPVLSKAALAFILGCLLGSVIVLVRRVLR